MIVSTETGGLGNRIKSWVSAMRLDGHARAYWEVLPNMPAAFSELFVNDCMNSKNRIRFLTCVIAPETVQNPYKLITTPSIPDTTEFVILCVF